MILDFMSMHVDHYLSQGWCWRRIWVRETLCRNKGYFFIFNHFNHIFKYIYRNFWFPFCVLFLWKQVSNDLISWMCLSMVLNLPGMIGSFALLGNDSSYLEFFFRETQNQDLNQQINTILENIALLEKVFHSFLDSLRSLLNSFFNCRMACWIKGIIMKGSFAMLLWRLSTVMQFANSRRRKWFVCKQHWRICACINHIWTTRSRFVVVSLKLWAGLMISKN